MGLDAAVEPIHVFGRIQRPPLEAKDIDNIIHFISSTRSSTKRGISYGVAPLEYDFDFIDDDIISKLREPTPSRRSCVLGNNLSDPAKQPCVDTKLQCLQ